jgi:hypothetical protein
MLKTAYTGDQIQSLQSFYTTPNKTLRGEGASDRYCKKLRKVLLQVNFGIAFYQSYLSMV